MNYAQPEPVRHPLLKMIGAFVGAIAAIHLVALICVPFGADLPFRVLLGIDLAVGVAFVCLLPFIIICGFIILIIGLGVRAGMAGRK